MWGSDGPSNLQKVLSWLVIEIFVERLATRKLQPVFFPHTYLILPPKKKEKKRKKGKVK